MEVYFPKPAPPIHPVLPSAAALAMEIEAGLVPALARLATDERLQILHAFDLAFAQRKTAIACLRTINIALSQAILKDAGLDPTITALLADRTSKVLKLLETKRQDAHDFGNTV